MESEIEARYELIDSFVYQVGQYLPESQRAEISSDLKQSIFEEIESVVEREGRGASEDELLEVIGRFGHPIKVANSYLPQRHLIGPEIFPVYSRALRTLLTLAVVGIVVFSLGMSASSDWQISVWSLLGSSFDILIWMAFVITVVFILLEYGGERLNWYENWDPRDLARNAVGPIDRSDVITNLISEGFFLLWWNDVIVLQNFIPDNVVPIYLSDVWEPYGLALNLIFGLSFLIHAYVLVLGNWRKFAMKAEVVLFSATAALGVALLTSGTLIEMPTELEEAISLEFIDNIVRTVLAVVILFTMWDILKGLKMWRGGFDAGSGVSTTK